MELRPDTEDDDDVGKPDEASTADTAESPAPKAPTPGTLVLPLAASLPATGATPTAPPVPATPESAATPAADPLADIRAQLQRQQEAHRSDVLTALQVPKDLQALPQFQGDPTDDSTRARWETEFRAMAERLALPVRPRTQETAAEAIEREFQSRKNTLKSSFYSPEEHRKSLLHIAKGPAR